MTDESLALLRQIVGASHVITDADASIGYLTDWTGRYTGNAFAVVRPGSTAEVVDVVKVCAARGISICPQGGNTGLVGGSVPPASTITPTIVLSTTRLNDVGELNVVDQCIDVGAGVTVAEIARRAGEVGLAFGIDLASRDSATAGGIVATNAGGIHTVAHGNTRAQVHGIEAVLADGSVLRRYKALAKDNVGYDLPGLLAGSEGTLAIITRVLFRLVSPPKHRVVALAECDTASAAVELMSAVRNAGLGIEAGELMTAAGLDLVAAQGLPRPLASTKPFAVLTEVSGPENVAALLEPVLHAVSGIANAVGEEWPARRLWAVRESHAEAIAASSTQLPVKLDISVPRSALDAVLTELDDLAVAPYRAVMFGHVGDGNIHVNFLDVPADEQEPLTDSALRIVLAHNGSVSAEHGIGRAKTSWMSSRGDVDVAAMKTIRAALDPHGVLNPGVLW